MWGTAAVIGRSSPRMVVNPGRGQTLSGILRSGAETRTGSEVLSGLNRTASACGVIALWSYWSLV